MKQIRRGVFETNSSSTHSICLTDRDDLLVIPKVIHFGLDEFGWEHETYHDMTTKAAYLYTAIMTNGVEGYLDNIKEILDKNGILYTFDEPKYYKGQDYQWLENGSIDHSCDFSDAFFNDICTNEANLLRYLFSEESFVITGNDNQDSYRVRDDVKVSYPHREYYKGN
jgi:hypothetical protein